MQRSRDHEPIKLVRKKLDGAGIEAHFAEVAERARAIEIRTKDASTDYSSATAAQLHEVVRRLRAGELVAVQIRFVVDDVWWCDTAMRGGEGFRLVRMRQSR